MAPTGNRGELTADDKEYLKALLPVQAYWWSRDLNFLMNTLMSGDIHIIAGGVKVGKSTATQEAVVGFINQGFGVWADITELSLAEYHDRWVAGEAALDYDKVRRGQWSELPRGSQALVEQLRKEYVEKFGAGDRDTDRLRLEYNPLQTPEQVYANMKECAKQGRRVYVLDSISQLTFPAGVQKNAALEECLSKIKTLSGYLKLIPVIVTQFNRDDRAGSQAFSKPHESWLQGSSKLEQIASQIIAITRAPKVMDPEVFVEKVKQFRAQALDLSELVQPNVSRLHCMIHRDKGASKGRVVDLAYSFGRLVDKLDAPKLVKDPRAQFHFWTKKKENSLPPWWELRVQRELGLQAA